jgi:hypothetical protein
MPICDCSYHRTPCEILREINDHAQSILPNDKRIRELVCELEIMIKRLLPDVKDPDFAENEDVGTDLYVRSLPTYKYEGERNLESVDKGLDEDGNQKVRVIRC